MRNEYYHKVDQHNVYATDDMVQICGVGYTGL